MACPLSHGFLNKGRSNDNAQQEGANNAAAGQHQQRREERSSKIGARQSSVHITSALLGDEGEELEDTQTINLKHLRAAVLVLTNPSVLLLYIFSDFFSPLFLRF